MAYSSDLTEAEYELIVQYLPNKMVTKKREISYHSILNGIFYQLKNSCTWRDLPKDLPKWQTVYHYFRTWKQEGYWEDILKALTDKERLRIGKKNHS